MSTTTYSTAQEAAQAMRAAMTQQKGKDGNNITRLTAQAPQWMRDAVRKIHDVREFDDPDDLKYDLIAYYLGVFADYEEPEWDDYDLEGICDSFGDDGSYQWLRTSWYRLSYLDETRKGAGSMQSALDRAQLLEHREVFDHLKAALRAQVQAKAPAKAAAKAPATKRTTKKTKVTTTA